MNECCYCRGELVERLTTFVYEDDGQVWVVRNVPAFVCRQCGEKEYSQPTTERVLALLRKPGRPTEILHVPGFELDPV